MIDFLLSLIEVNEGVNYALLISLFIAYFFIIWFVICIWVFFDAKKRYPSVVTSVLFALFVLLFGPPAIIFYIMIRPEHTLEEEYFMDLALGGEKEALPIYFDGNKGFDISINFSVQPKASSCDKHKMTMNMEWMPHKSGGVYRDEKVKRVAGQKESKRKGQFLADLKEGVASFINEFKATFVRMSIGKKGENSSKKPTVPDQGQANSSQEKKEENDQSQKKATTEQEQKGSGKSNKKK